MTASAPAASPAVPLARRLALRRRWERLSLATRFALAAAAVLLPAALAIGAFVASRIEEAVVRNSANATAIFMESVIAPISQQLATQDTLSPGARRALEEIFGNTPLGERVVSYKFWREDGTLIWAENQAIVGQRFELTDDLRRAWGGEVRADFDALGDAEDAAEAALGLPLLEIYSPIRAVWSGEVIAVAEFYEVAPELARDLRAARRGAWAAVGGLTAGLGLVLYAIVLGGSRMIESQRRALDARLMELEDLSARNRDLRLRVQAAAGRAAAAADRALRGLGRDLHDGPAQHLAYAALRLDSLRDRLAGRPEEAEADRVARAVGEAMAELRALSRGLQAPDIAGRPLRALVAETAEAHALRTGHPVALELACADDPPLPTAARLCAFRFLQEGLSNASRHAGGEGLEVALACGPQGLRLAVRDRGPGLPAAPREGAMGLQGLRDRVESLGGAFEARPRPGGGTEIAMTLETLP
jgi:signal transduction histidine kinase